MEPSNIKFWKFWNVEMQIWSFHQTLDLGWHLKDKYRSLNLRYYNSWMIHLMIKVYMKKTQHLALTFGIVRQLKAKWRSICHQWIVFHQRVYTGRGYGAWATGVPRAPPPPQGRAKVVSKWPYEFPLSESGCSHQNNLDRKHLICIKQDGRHKNYDFKFFVISPFIDGIFM